MPDPRVRTWTPWIMLLLLSVQPTGEVLRPPLTRIAKDEPLTAIANKQMLIKTYYGPQGCPTRKADGRW